MKGWDKLAALAGVLALAALSAAPQLRAETAAAGPKTLEEQVTYFENALSEALSARDWKMLEMAAEGFKALKLSGKDLEISVLRAERNVVWGGSGAFGELPPSGGGANRALVECWGLAVRGMFGNADALKSLRALATAELAAVNSPDPKTYNQNRVAYMAAQKAYTAYTTAVQKKDQACLALALLKDPDIQKVALERVRTWKKASSESVIGVVALDPVVEAVLAAEPQAGWKALTAALDESDEKVSSQAKIHLIRALMILCQWRNPQPQFAGMAFSIDTDIAGLLPQDAQMQLVKHYTVAVKNWNLPQRDILWPLIHIANNLLPLLPENSETLIALEGLKARMANDEVRYANRQQFEQALDSALAKQKKNGKNTQGAVKPPKVENADW